MFDDCCKRIAQNPNTTDFLLNLNRYISDQTVFILPPEPQTNNIDETFLYSGLPELKLENFDAVDSKKNEDTIKKNNEELNSSFNHLSLNELLAKRLLNPLMKNYKRNRD